MTLSYHLSVIHIHPSWNCNMTSKISLSFRQQVWRYTFEMIHSVQKPLPKISIHLVGRGRLVHTWHRSRSQFANQASNHKVLQSKVAGAKDRSRGRFPAVTAFLLYGYRRVPLSPHIQIGRKPERRSVCGMWIAKINSFTPTVSSCTSVQGASSRSS